MKNTLIFLFLFVCFSAYSQDETMVVWNFNPHNYDNDRFTRTIVTAIENIVFSKYNEDYALRYNEQFALKVQDNERSKYTTTYDNEETVLSLLNNKNFNEANETLDADYVIFGDIDYYSSDGIYELKINFVDLKSAKIISAPTLINFKEDEFKDFDGVKEKIRYSFSSENTNLKKKSEIKRIPNYSEDLDNIENYDVVRNFMQEVVSWEYLNGTVDIKDILDSIERPENEGWKALYWEQKIFFHYFLINKRKIEYSTLANNYFNFIEENKLCSNEYFNNNEIKIENDFANIISDLKKNINNQIISCDVISNSSEKLAKYSFLTEKERLLTTNILGEAEELKLIFEKELELFNNHKSIKEIRNDE